MDEAGDRTVAALRGAAARAHALRAADLTGRGRVARALDLPGLQEASRVWTAPAAGLATAAIGAGRLNPAWASAARGALWPTASIAASWRLDKYLTMPRPGAPLFASLSASNTLTKALMANAVKSTLAGPVGFTGAAPPDFTRNIQRALQRSSALPAEVFRAWRPPDIAGFGPSDRLASLAAELARLAVTVADEDVTSPRERASALAPVHPTEDRALAVAQELGESVLHTVARAGVAAAS